MVRGNWVSILNFIGCGSAFNTKLGNNSAVITEEDSLFLIDCGSSTFSDLMEMANVTKMKHITVVLTHLHPDHVGSLGDLIFYSYYVLNTKVRIYFPHPPQVKGLLACMGVSDDLYCLSDLADGKKIECGNLDVFLAPEKASHAPQLDCYGYFINYDGNHVYYSGDSNQMNQSAIKELKEGTLDAYYQDTCQLEYEGNVHFSISKLTETIKEPYRSKIHCMHLDNNFDKEAVKALGFNVVERISK